LYNSIDRGELNEKENKKNNQRTKNCCDCFIDCDGFNVCFFYIGIYVIEIKRLEKTKRFHLLFHGEPD